MGGAIGYVILYSVDGGSNITQPVERNDHENNGNYQEPDSTTLSNLSKGLYSIAVFAYNDLPSLLSDPMYVRLDGEGIQ